jgi:excisionase family DNA binding protein
MNIREVSAKIQISVSTLRKYVMLKKMPFKKVGARVVFDEADIDAWLNGHSLGLDSIKARPGGNRKGVTKNAELFPVEKEV